MIRGFRTQVYAQLALATIVATLSGAAERPVVTLRDMSKEELKAAGMELSQTTSFRIVARGAGGSQCDNFGSREDERHEMFAYGWIINADTRRVVWEMTPDNTSRSRDDRTFDGHVTLARGSYEVYFAAATFTHVTTFKNMSVNVDHRDGTLFNYGVREPTNKLKGWFEGWFSDWFGDDIRKDWENRSTQWGLEMLVDASKASAVRPFSPPKAFPNVLVKETGRGENEFIAKDFTVTEPVNVRIYALGEGYRNSADLVDCAWIISAADRSRVWEMKWRNSKLAGGASKNALFDGEVSLPRGDYTLYYVTDNSHSSVDWNCGPPYDPMNYGVTVMATNEGDKANFKLVTRRDESSIILSMTRIEDSESRSEGFTLKEDAKIRVYAIGEQSYSRRIMADYAVILDARTRARVWTMNADNTYHAGGAAKNRYVDEVITLPKGSYIVQYNADDSHAYNEWNADPPFDRERYGITLYGVGEKFDKSIVGKYVDQRDKNVLAQIIRAGNSINREQRFKLDKTTKIRIYAIGEGVGRDMADYGWITDNRTGSVVWEMTYSMTFHAGGARKNRMVNTTIILEKGEYTLHYMTDDSHAYRSWNQDAPEDPEYWGITLYPDEGIAPPVPPVPPKSPGSAGGHEWYD